MFQRFCPTGVFPMLIVAALAAGLQADEGGTNQQITTDEATAFSTKIERSLRAGDPSVFAGSVDDSAILDTASQGLTLTPEQHRGALSGMKVGAQIAQVVSTSMGKGGSYHLLHVSTVDGAPSPLFRLIAQGGALNYHRLSLKRGADGTIRIVDFYIYAAGEHISQTLHRPLVAMVASQNRNMIQRLLGSDNDYAVHIQEVGRFQQATSAGQWQQALDIYDALPDSLKQDKTMMLLRIKDSGMAGKDAYAKALGDFAKTFPGDPSLLLMNIDSLFLAKKYDEELKNIDAFDDQIGGDPYLDVMRGDTTKIEGRTGDALEFYHSAATREPSLRVAWQRYVLLTLQTRDWARLVDALDESARIGRLRWTRVNTARPFADFVKSDEYAQWVKTHPQEPPATQPAQ